MSKNNLYIGVPNGVVLCIDEPIREGLFYGELFHGYRDSGLKVISFEQFIQTMGRLFDELNHPRANIRERSFTGSAGIARTVRNRKERIMSDKELLAKHGEIATFIIRVQQRQNSTWQGRITWVDEDKTMHFRSILELIKLIESGIKASDPEPEEERDLDW